VPGSGGLHQRCGVRTYYVEKILTPTLEPEQEVVVMDNPSLPTRARGSKSSSRGRGQSCCTCHPTRRTSTPSRKPSPRSRASCKKPRLAPQRPWSRLWDRRSRRSAPKMLGAFLTTVGTTRRFNRYDERCKDLLYGLAVDVVRLLECDEDPHL
jgi:hypothetical protein